MRKLFERLRRRWKTVLGLAWACLCVLWLLQPASPPSHSLATRLPADLALAIELRDATTAWGELRRQIALLPGTPAGAAWTQTAPGLDARLPELLEQMERLLDEPGGWGGVRRALRGAVALGVNDLHGRDAALLLQTDWLSRQAILRQLATRGTETPEGWKLIVAGRNLHFAQADGLILAATTTARLRSVRQALASPPGPVIPPCHFVLQAKMNRRLREALHDACGKSFWAVRDGTLRIALTRDEISFAGALGFCGRDSSPLLPPPPLDLRPGEAGAQGHMRFAPLWKMLSARIWDEGRPLRGVSRPLTVPAWELLDRCFSSASGPFALRLGAAPNDPVQPAAPLLALSWTTPEAARIAFEEDLARLVALFSAPGGAELYEKIRSQTRLERGEGSSRLHLHPLFFHRQTPAWTWRIGAFRFVNREEALGREPAPPTAGPGLASIRLGWTADAPGARDLLRFVRDLAIARGFAPEPDRPQVEEFLRLAEGFSTVWAGDAFLTAPENGGSIEAELRLSRTAKPYPAP